MPETVNSSLRTAVKGIALVLAGMALSMPLSFAAKILVVRNTTKEEFGIYSLAVAIVSIMSLVSTLGLQEGVPRYVSIALGEGRRDDADSISRASLRIGLISGLTFSLLLFLFSGLMARHVFYMPELETPLRVISFFVLFSAMSQITGGILRGYNIIRPKVYYLDVGWPLFFILFLGVVPLLKLSVISVFYAYMLSMAMVLVAMGSHGYKKIRLNPLPVARGRHSKELLRFSMPLLMGSLLGVMMMWTDTLMLGRYTTAEDVGVYNISVTLAWLLLVPFGASMFVFMPIAGEMYGKNQLSELKRAYQVLTKWNFSVTLPVFIVLFLFPEMTVTFLFGERFIGSVMPLKVLSLGFLLHAFLGITGIPLTIVGLPKTIMKVSVFGAAMNVALNYIFIKRLGYGIVGASVATMVSYVGINAIASMILFRKTGIHAFTLTYLRPAAGTVAIGVIIYAIAKNLPLFFWMLPVYLALFIGGYCAVLLLSHSLDEEDITILEAISARTGLRLAWLKKLARRFSH